MPSKCGTRDRMEPLEHPILSAYDQCTASERVFVDAYLRPGYDSKAERSLMLSRPIVRAAVAERRKLLTDALEISAENVLREVKYLAFNNMQDYVNDDRTFKDWSTLTRGQWAAIKKIKVTEKFNKDGDHIATTTEFELYDKQAANRTLLEYMERYAPDVFREMITKSNNPASDYAKLIDNV